jgi:hypothetical protein
MFERKTVLVIDFQEMPESIKQELSRWERFGNDRVLPLVTYQFDEGLQPPEQMFQVENFEDLFDRKVSEGKFSGSIDDFVRTHGLAVHYWFAQQGQNLTGIDEVLIDICW